MKSHFMSLFSYPILALTSDPLPTQHTHTTHYTHICTDLLYSGKYGKHFECFFLNHKSVLDVAELMSLLHKSSAIPLLVTVHLPGKAMYYQGNSHSVNARLCGFSCARLKAIVHQYRSKWHITLLLSSG